MATSQTYDFNLDLWDLIEESYERCGIEMRTGHQLRTARRSLDLLLTTWANNQVNLWTIDQTSQALTANTASYTINAPALDILDGVCRDSDSLDTPMERMSIEEYLNLPDPSITGRPSHFAVKRNVSNLTLYLWPAPRNSTDTFVFWRMRYIQDAGVYTNNPEVPKRFIPALVSGLAWYLAVKNPAQMVQSADGQIIEINGVGQQRRLELRDQYVADYTTAVDEDRDRAPLFITPYGGY